MEAVLQWLGQLELDGLLSGAILLCASILCIVFHETCHGITALLLGDPTAKQAGRLTLNPLRHIDPFGLVMMAAVRFGWAKAVPVNMQNFRHPKRDMAITALAGPVSNLLLAMVALLLRAVVCYVVVYQMDSPALGYAITFLEYTAVLSVGLAVFNFLPISPLDGSKVLFAFLPDCWYRKLLRYERYGMILLMLLLLTGVLTSPLVAVRSAVLNVLSQLCWQPYRWLAGL